MITISDAIKSLVPNAPGHYATEKKITGWDMGEEKTGIPQPTQAEIDAEIIRLQEIYDSQEYQRKRDAEYPSIKDQLDKIYHEGIDKWKEDMIKPVKDKHPKD